MGSSIGRYLAKVISWDFEVSDDDPVVNLELLPVRPSEVDQLLNRNRAPAAWVCSPDLAPLGRVVLI